MYSMDAHIPPRREYRDRSCFACRHCRGLDESGTAALCGLPGAAAVKATPEHGCASWQHDASADPDVITADDWIARHGVPVRGFLPGDVRPWPPAMSAAEIRAAYTRNRSPEVRRLAWEIARLRDEQRRTVVALEWLAGMAMPEPVRERMRRLIDLLRGTADNDKKVLIVSR